MREAIETREGIDSSGEIIKLGRYCPWKEHLYELEQELSIPQQIKFCLYEVDFTRYPKDSTCRSFENMWEMAPSVMDLSTGQTGWHALCSNQSIHSHRSLIVSLLQPEFSVAMLKQTAKNIHPLA